MKSLRYSCDICNITTNIKSIYNRHLTSAKHNKLSNPSSLHDIHCNTCDICNKKYISRTGYWRHKKTCKVPENHFISLSQGPQTLQEIKEEIKEEIKIEMKNLAQVIAEARPQNINNNNNNIETQNNNFNINLYLNENVKPSMNFVDWIKSTIKIDHTYKQKITDNGYLETMNEIVRESISSIPFIERPIHCIKNEVDFQEIIHIRGNNEWKKETELDWTNEINNYYNGENDPPDDAKKRIFVGLVQMESQIFEQMKDMFGHSIQYRIFERDYEGEMHHVPNKLKIIKSFIEYTKMDDNEFKKLVDNYLHEKENATLES